MNPPDCPDHGRLVLELAFGRLDDVHAAEAESVRSSCPVCSAWWNDVFSGGEAATIDAAVSTAFESFEPARPRSPVWLAAAAAAITIGGAVVWYTMSPDPPTTRDLVQKVFEGVHTPDHDVNGDGITDASDLATLLSR
jgi:hypothetical protein